MIIDMFLLTNEIMRGIMTLRPARLLQLDDCGIIRVGALADLLVFQARDLHELFHSFGRNRLHRIIHQGVHIYPHVII